MKKLGITGHRPKRLGVGYDLKDIGAMRIYTILLNKIEKLNPDILISGMALGVDQWAAIAANTLGIPFIAAMPCDDMWRKWPQKSQDEFHSLLDKAKEKVVVSPGPYAGWKLNARNRYIVDNCDQLLAIFDGVGNGGTANAVNYATEKNKEIILVNPGVENDIH